MGSEFISSFQILILCTLDESSARDVRVTVGARAREERIVNPIAALPKCVYLLEEGAVVFRSFCFDEVNGIWTMGQWFDARDMECVFFPSSICGPKLRG
jgi:hypothetical protein